MPQRIGNKNAWTRFEWIGTLTIFGSLTQETESPQRLLGMRWPFGPLIQHEQLWYNQSKLSIHPWTEQWGDLGAKASLRYTLDSDLKEHDKFLAVIRLVMDLILRGLHLQEGPVDQTVYQNMMYAAGTSVQKQLKLANVNFGVGDVLVQPASDAGQHEVNIDRVEDLSCLWTRSPFVPEHLTWGSNFSNGP